MVCLSARKERGRKQDRWVDVLHADLKSLVDWLRRMGLKFWNGVIIILSFKLHFKNKKEKYTSYIADPWCGTNLSKNI